MVRRYEPDMHVSDSIETEEDRVEFLTTVANALANKAKLKLNTKRLYAADGRAVKELLKVANMLSKAQAARVSAEEVKDDEEEQFEVATLRSKGKDIGAARTLAAEITEVGAKVYDLLGSETEIKEHRRRALDFLDTISSSSIGSTSSEQKYLQNSINELVATVTEDIEAMKKQCDDLDSDEKALGAKIKKKQTELERQEKRLKSLQTVRPAFMDEYEKLEKDLQTHYDSYLERYRNLDYLRHELEAYNKAEQERMEEDERALKKMQNHLRTKELETLRGAGEEFLVDDDEDDERDLRSAQDKSSASTNKKKMFAATVPQSSKLRSSATTNKSSTVKGSMMMSVPVEADEESEESQEIVSRGSEDESDNDDDESVSIAHSSKTGSDDMIDDHSEEEDDMLSEGDEDYPSGHSSNGDF